MTAARDKHVRTGSSSNPTTKPAEASTNEDLLVRRSKKRLGWALIGSGKAVAQTYAQGLPPGGVRRRSAGRRDWRKLRPSRRPAAKRLALTQIKVVLGPLVEAGVTSDDKIVAVGFLSARDLEVLGAGLRRHFPIPRDGVFASLLQRLDEISVDRPDFSER